MIIDWIAQYVLILPSLDCQNLTINPIRYLFDFKDVSSLVLLYNVDSLEQNAPFPINNGDCLIQRSPNLQPLCPVKAVSVQSSNYCSAALLTRSPSHYSTAMLWAVVSAVHCPSRMSTWISG